jgi:hypothetical protein
LRWSGKRSFGRYGPIGVGGDTVGGSKTPPVGGLNGLVGEGVGVGVSPSSTTPSSGKTSGPVELLRQSDSVEDEGEDSGDEDSGGGEDEDSGGGEDEDSGGGEDEDSGGGEDEETGDEEEETGDEGGGDEGGGEGAQ